MPSVTELNLQSMPPPRELGFLAILNLCHLPVALPLTSLSSTGTVHSSTTCVGGALSAPPGLAVINEAIEPTGINVPPK